MANHPRIESAACFIGKGGGNLISFGSGQPDLPPPAKIFRAQERFQTFRYGPVQGDERLRDALARGYPGTRGEEFVVTNGASEALDLFLRAVARPGGKVLLPKPYYYSYPHNVRLAGMTPKYYRLRDGKIDFDEFAEQARGCHVLLINSPGNPTGTVQDIATLKKIEAYARRTGTFLISDEIYKDLIYERENYPMKGDTVITINSFSKTYAMCGLRVGYLHTKDRAVMEKMVEIKSHTSMNTNTLAQEMALAALGTPKRYIADQLGIWRSRRDYIYESMLELGLDLWRPEGAFYVFPRLKDPTRAMHDLYYRYHIITYNGAWFGDPTRLRFSYALDLGKMAQGMERLAAFLGKEYRRYT